MACGPLLASVLHPETTRTERARWSSARPKRAKTKNSGANRARITATATDRASAFPLAIKSVTIRAWLLSSRNAVSFSAALTMNRFPLSQRAYVTAGRNGVKSQHRIFEVKDLPVVTFDAIFVNSNKITSHLSSLNASVASGGK